MSEATVGIPPTVSCAPLFITICVESFEALDKALFEAKARDELTFIEVKCAIGARADLGRPTTTAIDNKNNFMEYLQNG